jgi:CRISPR/Cas system CMR subunit Cmr6 (Cas7 group RAMP superfamily)
MNNDQQRFRLFLLRDKDWLEELYVANSALRCRRLLLFASDSKLDTLMKYLHYLSNGEIRMKRENFDTIQKRHLSTIKRAFESKQSLNRSLKLEREQKLKVLLKLTSVYQVLLHSLFNLS